MPDDPKNRAPRPAEVSVTCPGGHTFAVKRMFAGTLQACPECGQKSRVPPAYGPPRGSDPAAASRPSRSPIARPEAGRKPRARTALLAGAALLLAVLIARQVLAPAEELLVDGIDRVEALSWSPDGRYLAIATGATADPAAGLLIYDFKQGSTHPLPVPCLHSTTHTWLPDGSLACDGWEEDGVSQSVLVFNPSDGSGKKVTRGHGSSWSSDGRSVAHVCWTEDGSSGRYGGLCVTDTWRAETKRLCECTPDKLRFQPGGSMVAFDCGSIWGMDADGTGIKRLSGSSDHLSWTPDGRRVVFGLERLADGWFWMAASPDGSPAETLLEVSVDPGLVDWPTRQLALTPDGRWAVFATPSLELGEDLVAAEVGATSIQRIAPKGGGHVGYLTFALSPDSKRVVYSRLNKERGCSEVWMAKLPSPSRQGSAPGASRHHGQPAAEAPGDLCRPGRRDGESPSSLSGEEEI